MDNSKSYRVNDKEIVITHPDKILIQQGLFSKEDLVHYYQAVGNLILKFGKCRPLSMLRYPEGYPGKSFFQRNKPNWAPKWIKSQNLGVVKKADYILLDNLATLIWLVNLGCLEFHTALVAAPNFDKPDTLVFDLDPPKNCTFADIRDFTFKIKPVIESFGYKTFVKTSGKLGIHIYCPIEPKWSFDEVFEASKNIAEEIVLKFSESTLKITKKERLDKILVDIYRNHSYQSMVLPYGLRATPEATVSMPLAWEKLKKVKSAQEFTIRTIPDWIKNNKDPWAGMKKKAVKLHL